MSDNGSMDKCSIWKERITNWKESGVSLAKWSRDRNLSYWQCSYWKIRLLGPDRENVKASTPKGFYEIDSDAKGPSGISIEVGGIRIYIEIDFDPSTLSKCITLCKGSVPFFL